MPNWWTKAQVLGKKLSGGDGFDHPQWVEDVGNFVLPDTWTKTVHGEVVATVDDVTKTALTIEAFVGQTAPTLEVKDENGVTIFKTDQLGIRVFFDDSAGHTITTDDTGAIDSSGGAHFGTAPDGLIISSDGSCVIALAASQTFTIYRESGVQVLNVSTVDAGPVLELSPKADTEALIINGFGGTHDAIQYFGPPNFAGEFRVLAGGAIVSGQATAIADGDLANSQFGLWLDDTPGATALHIKAKDSAGTVRTATIPLA